MNFFTDAPGHVPPFSLITGHSLVPQAYPKLGEWVKRQRRCYKFLKEGRKQPNLTPEQALRLQEIGFIFDVRKQQRQQKVEEESKQQEKEFQQRARQREREQQHQLQHNQQQQRILQHHEMHIQQQQQQHLPLPHLQHPQISQQQHAHVVPQQHQQLPTVQVPPPLPPIQLPLMQDHHNPQQQQPERYWQL